MLVAAVAAGFTSCKKDSEANNDDQTTTHAQTFTLGETTYHVDNAIAIKNIQYHDGDQYNAIILSQGNLIGEEGVEGQGIVIVFKGAIQAGTYSLVSSVDAYPKYIFTYLSVLDVVNFDWHELLDDERAYEASSGALNLEISGKKYTITTDNVVVRKSADPNDTDDSSVDCEKTVSEYVLATMDKDESCTVTCDEQEVEIVTAGRMEYKFPLMGKKNVACFITADGDLIGFQYQGATLPVGQLANPTFVYLEGMDINHPYGSVQGGVNIASEGDVYTVDITDAVINNKTYNMHYKGTLPFFDFPF